MENVVIRRAVHFAEQINVATDLEVREIVKDMVLGWCYQNERTSDMLAITSVLTTSIKKPCRQLEFQKALIEFSGG